MEEIVEMNIFEDLDLARELLHNFSSLITDGQTVANTINGKWHFWHNASNTQAKYAHIQLVKCLITSPDNWIEIDHQILTSLVSLWIVLWQSLPCVSSMSYMCVIFTVSIIRVINIKLWFTWNGWLNIFLPFLSTSDITNVTNSLQVIVNNSLNKLENMTDLVRVKRSWIS